MIKKILILSISILMMGGGLIAQNENAKGNAYGKAKSLENRADAMTKKIEMAKAKLAEHRDKGTMPEATIAKKEAKIAALEANLKNQKLELANAIKTPTKPGKTVGKPTFESNNSSNGNGKTTVDNKGNGKPSLEVPSTIKNSEGSKPTELDAKPKGNSKKELNAKPKGNGKTPVKAPKPKQEIKKIDKKVKGYGKKPQ